jgi:type IV pilus assembly protein PilX
MKMHPNKSMRIVPLKAYRASQRGVALMVVLVLLLIMTLLGLASLRGGLLQDRMTSGEYDRSLAFQAAEGALREAEARLLAGGYTFPTSGTACVAGLCPKPDATVTGFQDRWLDPAFNASSCTTNCWYTASVGVGTLGIRPQYFIELMGPAANWFGCDQLVPMQSNCLTPRYRITARSTASNRAAVVLQSNFAAP